MDIPRAPKKTPPSGWTNGSLQPSKPDLAAASSMDTSLRGTETILIVEDDPMLLDVLSGILRQLGYNVIPAGSATEAQRLAKSHGRIGLLITDFSIPESNGLELALWFRAAYPEMKVLIASGSLWELKYHADDIHQFAFLAKPFTPYELARVVRLMLEPRPKLP